MQDAMPRVMDSLGDSSGDSPLVNMVVNQLFVQERLVSGFGFNPNFIDYGRTISANLYCVSLTKKLWMLAQHLPPKPPRVPGKTRPISC